MVKILHFADAHIDMANYGRHDPETGLPLRVLDYLKSLDAIVEAAISEKVDLVLFAGDTYKDRSPAPTFQREWGKRIMHLSKAGIPTLLLVGNHDISPALGRAHAIEEYITLEVPHVHVLDRPVFLGSDQLEDLPLQVIALPWIARSGLMAHLGLSAVDPTKVFEEIETRLTELVNGWLVGADPDLPVVLTAHCSVQGAKYGSERTVMLGGDLVLSGSFVRDPRLAYVALGHIHKAQDLNENAQPPVVYPGSIERVDFGEAGDDKYYVIAHVEHGHTRVEWRLLEGIRPFIDRFLRLTSPEGISEQLRAAVPEPDQLQGAIVRLILEYPRDWESLIDESVWNAHRAQAFEFHFVKRPLIEARVRLPRDQAISSLTSLDLLEKYWGASDVELTEREALQKLAREIIQEAGE